jgi:lipoprotein-anchoring transpeptidase ErfK/SrfK
MIDTAATRLRRTARVVAWPAALALAAAATVAGCGGSSRAPSSVAPISTVTVAVHHNGAGAGHGHDGGDRDGGHAHGAADRHADGARHQGSTATTHATRTTAKAAAASSQTRTHAGAAAPTRHTHTHPRAHAEAPARPTTVALVKRAVAMRSAPGHAGHVVGRLATRTQFGSATAVPIMIRRGAWLGVTSLVAGNNRLGWIPRSAVSMAQTDWRLYVSLARQRITVSYGDRVIRRFRTSTGVVGASTPTGHFAVTDRLRTGVEDGPYGCCILALSAVQPRHLSDWDGGNRIAIHATVDTADLGRPASHGCAHVDDADGHWLLGHIPNGTPVVIENPPFHRGRGSPA